jgi:hypothetical protein
MIPAFDSRGLLPPGRYRSTVDEVEATLIDAAAFAASVTRRQVWDDFVAVVDLLHNKRVRVPAAFLGGGFTTSALDPSDIDVTLLFDATRISSPATFAEINKITSNAKATGLKVDAFTIPWWPDHRTGQSQMTYRHDRGKWDDWWQRHVPKADRHPPQRHHAMPVRGYLEVILDGYT